MGKNTLVAMLMASQTDTLTIHNAPPGAVATAHIVSFISFKFFPILFGPNRSLIVYSW